MQIQAYCRPCRPSRFGFSSLLLALGLASSLPASTPSREGASRPSTLLGRLLGGNDERQVLVYSFLSNAGRSLGAPDPERPLLCRLGSAGYQEWGPPRAGEKPLALDQIEPLIRGALRASGYEPLRAGDTPEVVVIFSWGHVRPEPEWLRNPRLESMPHQSKMLELLGGLSPEASNDPAANAAIVEAAMEERYFLIVSAYAASVDENRTRPLLWRTHISVPSAKLDPEGAFPTLASAGAVKFGRETTTPWLVTVDFKAAARIKRMARE